jgi:hypothetical protein
LRAPCQPCPRPRIPSRPTMRCGKLDRPMPIRPSRIDRTVAIPFPAPAHQGSHRSCQMPSFSASTAETRPIAEVEG